MIAQRKRLALILIIALVASGYGPCSSNQQPKTVADILVTLGNIKRDLRERERQVPGTGLTAQQDYDLSAKLLAANIAYKKFVTDEIARLDAGAIEGGAPDPSARQAAIRALITSLRGIQDPSVIGIKNQSAQKVWRDAIASLNTIIAGLEALQGGE